MTAPPLLAERLDVVEGARRAARWTFPAGTDLAGWSLSWHLKEKPSDVVTLLTLTSPSRLAVDTDARTVSLTLTAAETAALSPGHYVWDLWRTDAGAEDQLARGDMEVRRAVKTPA